MKVGDAIVALNAIAFVFAVILAVLDAIFVAFVVILEVFAAIALVFDVILAVFEVTLVSKAAISVVLAVILAVFNAILFVFVVMLVVLVAIFVAFVAIALVFAVMLEVFEVTLVSNAVMLFVLVVMLEVFEAINVGKVPIVDELTPPTVFTVGKSAVPPKSFVSLILPFTLAVASGVADAAIPEATPADKAACTNSVVAICVVFVPSAAVGAIGVPVNVGDALFAFNAIAAIFAVILAVLAAIFVVFVVIFDLFVAISEVFVVILAVLDVILVSNADSADCALAISAVILAVLELIFVSAAVTLVGKLEIVDELTPPTVFTVGKSAVPPKSLDNLIFPFTLAVASGVADAAIPEATPAVNAV